MQLRSNLSTASLQALIDSVERYKRDLENRINTILADLTQQGVDICRTEALALGINDTGNLLNSINAVVDEREHKALVIVNCDYAVFIEFGTGVKGKASGYVGDAISKTAYKHMGGSTYVTLADGRVGWYYPADDGSYRFTEGQASRPFMYNTAQQLRQLLRR